MDSALALGSCFNGAALRRARSDPVTFSALFEDNASTGPPSEERGVVGLHPPLSGRTKKLQRGRAPKSAE